MALTEPYSAWFDAVKTALATAGGPFAAANAIEFWIDDEVDWVAPSERLREALARTLPHCLICWPGGGADPRAGGGNSQREEINFTIRYACGAPQGGGDYEDALKATGSTGYFGAWVTHEWVLSKVFALDTVNGFETPAELLGMNGIAIERQGAVAFALRFCVKRLRVIND